MLTSFMSRHPELANDLACCVRNSPGSGGLHASSFGTEVPQDDAWERDIGFARGWSQ
jgi:hypothetical protein